jgi:hypothetical protein
LSTVLGKVIIFYSQRILLYERTSRCHSLSQSGRYSKRTGFIHILIYTCVKVTFSYFRPDMPLI